MNLLALETSSSVATIAVMEDDKLILETVINYKKNHSEKLMPLIAEALEHLQLKPKDIDVFATSIGPGSFTGLRIGVTTVKAMAQALDKPVIGITSLEGLAFNIPFANGLICPIIDAQREMVYTGLYKWKVTDLEEVMEEQVLSIEDLIGQLSTLDKDVIFVGDAVEKFSDVLQQELSHRAKFPPHSFRLTRAASVAELARRKVSEGKISKASELVPFYMRKSQAENQYDERMKEGKEGE